VLISVVVSSIAIQLVFFAGTYLFCNDFQINGIDPLTTGRKALILLSITEFWFMLLFPPIIYCLILPATLTGTDKSIIRTAPYGQYMRWKSTVSFAAFSILLSVPVIIPAVYLTTWNVPFADILRLVTTFMLIGLGVSALSRVCSSVSRDVFASITAVFFILAAVTGGIILANPFIELAPAPEGIIYATLLINPFVAVTSSIHFDVLRTDPLYYLSSISAYQFHYPGLLQYWIFFGFMFIILFIISIKYSENRWRDS
jgi:hypothetical protein